MVLFGALLGLNSLLKKIGSAPWLSSAEYWIYPAQTILCGGLLLWFRREYNFHRLRQPLFSVGLRSLPRRTAGSRDLTSILH